MKIKAIPTIYKNIKFKSKLEASYAKLFDKYNIPWIYEPLTINFGEIGYCSGKHNMYYTPDFKLGKSTFFEIKNKEGLDCRSKEMFFMLNNRLYLGFSFWPEQEPTYIYYYKQVILKNDGYSNYVTDTGISKIKFKDFVKCIK